MEQAAFLYLTILLDAGNVRDSFTRVEQKRSARLHHCAVRTCHQHVTQILVLELAFMD